MDDKPQRKAPEPAPRPPNTYPRHIEHRERLEYSYDPEDGEYSARVVDSSEPVVTAWDRSAPTREERDVGSLSVTPNNDGVEVYSTGRATIPDEVKAQLKAEAERTGETSNTTQALIYTHDIDTRDTETRPGNERTGFLTRAGRFAGRAGEAARGATEKARLAAANAAEGFAGSLEKRAQIKDAQDRLNRAGEIMAAEEAARREQLGRGGRAAEDSRSVAARLRGEPAPDIAGSTRYARAAQRHEKAAAEIAAIKGGQAEGGRQTAEAAAPPDTTAAASAPQEPTNVFDPPQGPDEQPAEVPTEGTPTEQSGFLSRAGDAARGATARARTAAAGAAEGVAASIEKRAQIKDAQDRVKSAREVMDAEEAARREKLGRSGRAAEDSRRVAARLRGEPVPDVERSSRHTSAEKLHDEASAEIASIKSGDPAGAAAGGEEPFFEDQRAAVVEPSTEPYFPEDRQQRTDVDPFDGSAPARARDVDDQDDSSTDDKFSHENSDEGEDSPAANPFDGYKSGGRKLPKLDPRDPNPTQAAFDAFRPGGRSIQQASMASSSPADPYAGYETKVEKRRRRDAWASAARELARQNRIKSQNRSGKGRRARQPKPKEPVFGAPEVTIVMRDG